MYNNYVHIVPSNRHALAYARPLRTSSFNRFTNFFSCIQILDWFDLVLLVMSCAVKLTPALQQKPNFHMDTVQGIRSVKVNLEVRFSKVSISP